MHQQIAESIDRNDLKTAARLLKTFKQQEPENPWIEFYAGRMYEAIGKLENARKVYRQLLQNAANPKILSQARQGIERLEKLEQQKRQQTLDNLLAEPSDRETGVLILEPILPELKQNAAQKFAEILQIDAYSARLQLPSRCWRLYRTGKIGELKYYVSAFLQAGIPCFCVPISEIEKLATYQVDCFDLSSAPFLSAVYQNQQGNREKIHFHRSEVTQRVEGLLPLFEKILETDPRGKHYRKTQTLDYVQICDLHLPKQRIILRLCDRNYQFQHGISLTSPGERTTTRTNWNNLERFLTQQLPDTRVWSDFTPFAQTAIDFQEMLRHIKPRINLLRREETLWDPAFHLYSALAFLKNFPQS